MAEIPSQKVLVDKASEVAFSYRIYGRYGSAEKATAALGKRKGCEDFSQQEVAHEFYRALEVIDTMKVYMERHRGRLQTYTTAEVKAALKEMKVFLEEKCPEASEQAISLAQGWGFHYYFK